MCAHQAGCEVAGMHLTAQRFTAAAGLCAAAAGAIFVGVQINHPPADVAHLVTTEMTIRESAKVLFCILALIGFAGMFLRHRGRLGAMGVAGFALLNVGFLALLATECIVGYVLPSVAHSHPGHVQDILTAAVGGHPRGHVGPMQYLFLAAGIGFPFGGLLFGIALFRARILARWACLLLAYGTVSVLALAALPESFNRPFAVPTGVALIGLGISLWRDQRVPATAWIAEPATR
jgi:hypothetical protein